MSAHELVLVLVVALLLAPCGHSENARTDCAPTPAQLARPAQLGDRQKVGQQLGSGAQHGVGD